MQTGCPLAYGQILQTLAECQSACRRVLSTFVGKFHLEGIFWNLQIISHLLEALISFHVWRCAFFSSGIYYSACYQLARQLSLNSYEKKIIIIYLKTVGHLHFPYKLLIFLVFNFFVQAHEYVCLLVYLH